MKATYNLIGLFEYHENAYGRPIDNPHQAIVQDATGQQTTMPLTFGEYKHLRNVAGKVMPPPLVHGVKEDYRFNVPYRWERGKN